MAKYYVLSNGQKYKVRDLGYQYVFGENHQEDIVHLKFDKQNGKFLASIEKPSQHTQYLFNQGKLGFAIIRRNCARKWHRKNHREKLRSHTHARWSRLRNHYILVNDLNHIEMSLKKLDGSFRPVSQPKWLRNSYNFKEYIHVKGILLTITSEEAQSDTYRAYKTCSNTLWIEHKYNNGKNQYSYKYEPWQKNQIQMTIAPGLNLGEVEVTISSLPDDIYNLLLEEKLYIGTEYEDVSKHILSHGRKTRLKRGDPYKEASNDEEKETARRSKYYLYQYKEKRIKTMHMDVTYPITNTELPFTYHYEIDRSEPHGARYWNFKMRTKTNCQVIKQPIIVLFYSKESAGNEKLKRIPVTWLNTKWTWDEEGEPIANFISNI